MTVCLPVYLSVSPSKVLCGVLHCNISPGLFHTWVYLGCPSGLLQRVRQVSRDVATLTVTRHCGNRMGPPCVGIPGPRHVARRHYPCSCQFVAPRSSTVINCHSYGTICKGYTIRVKSYVQITNSTIWNTSESLLTGALKHQPCCSII